MNNGNILHGDCLAILPTLADNSIDAILTDPPYHLSEVPHVKRGGFSGQRDDERKAARAGFMHRQWDGGDIAFRPDVWRECLRVLKPGGHMCVFGGSRTHHRLWCAIEDAGFELRDTLMWLYGQGFPKSLDVSKAIDKHLGAEREVVGKKAVTRSGVRLGEVGIPSNGASEINISSPATAEAQQWDGWGTALKPAFEPVIWATKKYRDVPFISDMIELSDLIEALLWLTSPVSLVEEISQLSRVGFDEAESDSVRWIVAVCHGLLSSDPGQKTVISISPETASTCLSIVMLWNSILDGLWKHGSMFTTEMVSEMITDLRTLKFSISQIIPASIILDGTLANGFWLPATTAVPSSIDQHAGCPYLGTFAAESASLLPAVSKLLVKIAERLSVRLEAIGVSSVLRDAPTSTITENGKNRLSTLVHIAAMRSKPSPVESPNIADGIAWRELSPNIEPICLARKPLCGTVAENVLKHGVGGINVDACRVPTNGEQVPYFTTDGQQKFVQRGEQHVRQAGTSDQGRWPANVLHDGSEEVLAAFAQFQTHKAGNTKPQPAHAGKSMFGIGEHEHNPNYYPDDQGGSPARFFANLPYSDDELRFNYCAKAGKSDRAQSKHPCVKPIKLLEWLAKLITPPNGTILDPFAGSGTTGAAAVNCGFSAILIEREAEYIEDIRNRLWGFGVAAE